MAVVLNNFIVTVVEEGYLQQHVNSLRSTFMSRKRALCDALDEFCGECLYTQPNGGYFVWLHLPANVTGVLLSEAAKAHGVAFTPGSRCSFASSSDSSNCIRLSYSFYNEVELREGVKRLSCTLQSIQKTI